MAWDAIAFNNINKCYITSVALLAVHLGHVNIVQQYSGCLYCDYCSCTNTPQVNHKFPVFPLTFLISPTFPSPISNSLTFPGYPGRWPLSTYKQQWHTLLTDELGCSLGLERLGLQTVSGHFWTSVVSILSLHCLGIIQSHLQPWDEPSLRRCYRCDQCESLSAASFETDPKW